MKNIIKSETCQTEIRRKRRTPEELFNRTKEERQLIYDHRSPTSQIRKLRKKKTSPYLSDRKLIIFLEKQLLPTENKWEASKEVIIYNSENVELGLRMAKLFEGVPQFHIDSLRDPFSSPSPTRYLKPSTRPEKTGTGLLLKKEKRTMQADNTSTNPVRESIRNLTMLNLSKWGQIKLMAYPDQAIAHAYKELQHANPRDPFKWFVSLCLKYCKENQLAPDWTGMLTLSRTQNMPDDAPMTLGPLLKHQSKAGKAIPSKKAQSLLHATHLKAIRLFTEDVPRYKRSQFYVMRQLENSAQDYPQSRPAWEAWYNSDEATEFKAWLAEYPLEYVATWDPFTFDYDNHRRNLLEKDKSAGTVFANPYAIMSDNTQNNYDKKASFSYTSSSPVYSESMIHDLDEWRPNEVDSYLASDYESATIWE